MAIRSGIVGVLNEMKGCLRSYFRGLRTGPDCQKRLWDAYKEARPGLKGLPQDECRFKKHIEPALGANYARARDNAFNWGRSVSRA